MLDDIEKERYEIAKRRCKLLEQYIEESLNIIKKNEDFVSACEKEHKIESEFIDMANKKIELYSET